MTKLGHERHCNYLKLAQYWDNPNDADGEWPVDKVLSIRGPPGRRFVQLQWSEPEDDVDTTDFEHADLEVADGTTKVGDGGWKYGWQPIASCARLRDTLIHSWFQNHRDVDPRGSVELQGEWRCIHCNKVFE